MRPAPGARILVVDDEPGIRETLARNLEGHGYQVRSAETGAQALEAAARFQPDLVLLDLGLPDLDGTEVIERIRSRTSTPIVVLSVRGAERDKVRALELGADDYLTKPFGIDELLARVKVALRHAARTRQGADPVFRSGELAVDLDRREVTADGRPVHLTPTEYALLGALIAAGGRVLTDRALLQRVWGPEYGSENHYLHVYIGRLRKKLEPDPARPRYLRTEPGVGYRLVELEAGE
ncbi:MAG: response regulator transcription factor [Chloroflexota bacterium]|jgi:two-component system KDP operon response regulator KdpE|nr:response regulator transcription factor [Chloroflexota bacterium]